MKQDWATKKANSWWLDYIENLHAPQPPEGTLLNITDHVARLLRDERRARDARARRIVMGERHKWRESKLLDAYRDDILRRLKGQHEASM